MNARVRYKMGLELGDGNVERTFEAQGSLQQGNDFGQQPLCAHVASVLYGSTIAVATCGHAQMKTSFDCLP